MEIFIPFEEATDFVQNKKSPLSFVIPRIRSLKTHLKECQVEFQNRFVRALQSSMQSQLEVYESQDTFTTTVALDLRFKLAWCIEEEVEIFKKKLLSKVGTISGVEETIDMVYNSPQPSKCSHLFSFIDTQAQPLSSPSSSVKEVTSYLSDPTLPEDANPLDF